MEELKKIDRKRKRFAARLKTYKNIECTSELNYIIVLCNVGQATGFEKNNVLKLITDNSLQIECPKFLSEKGESHSFLIFKSIEDAFLFYNSLNGKAKVNENQTLLYMSFVQNVPNTEVICPHEEPKGLLLIKNFISSEEEQRFINLFDWSDNDSGLKNRQVKHFGYEFRYGSNDVDLDNPLPQKIPSDCDVIWQRLKKYDFDLGVPDQLTVNKYSPGQGIPLHVDRHSPFGPTILSLSLGSSVVMDWRHHSGIHVPVLLPERSMLVMQDEARYDWQHGIQPRTYDPIIESRLSENSQEIKVITSETVQRQTRISLTFRWTRRGSCECVYKTLCDYIERNAEEIDDKLAVNLEELHVHQVYEQIACHFSSTRHSPWPAVVEFVSRAPPAAVLLDLGAGNGKNIAVRNDIVQIACERSMSLLLEMCRSRGERLRLDMMHCCVRDNCADLVICIAVVHHIATKSRRIKALSEIYRVLAPSGLALITVWARDQSRSNYLLKSKLNQTNPNDQVNVAGVNLPVHENRTQFQHQDLLVPWKLRKKTNDKLENKLESTLLRYYHVFEEGELEELCVNVGFQIVRSFYEEGNWCVECKKTVV